MFLSKIWLFVVALAAAVILTIAIALPRSAHKSRVGDERQRLVVACDVVNLLLGEKARDDVTVVGNLSRDAGLVTALGKVKPDAEVVATASPAKDVDDTLDALMDKVEGHKPTLAMVTDARGRVIARAGVDEGQVGDVQAGRALVDDALSGYLRDDVWVVQGSMFLVAGSPVVARSTAGDDIIGAAVLGWKLDNDLADGFVAPFKDSGIDKDAENRSIHVAFFAGGKGVAKSSTTATLDTDLMAAADKAQKPAALADDCKQIAPFYAHDGTGEYAALMSRLPGESAHDGAFFAVFGPRPAEGSFGAAVGSAKGELGGGFPWIAVGVIFVLAFGVGVVLMFVESDRPLRKLQGDAVRLGKGELERLGEDSHGGRFGSIARSINIQIDKLHRDAKSAKKDLDQLLGPAPEGSLGALDLLAGTPLPARPAPIAVPSAPPPSEFRFSDMSGNTPAPKRTPAPAGPELDLGPARPAAPGLSSPAIITSSPPARPTPPPKPPIPVPSRPPVPAAAAPKKNLDEDILSIGDESGEQTPMVLSTPTPMPMPVPSGPDPDEAVFRDVFEQFLELKKKCGESTAGLTLAKFGDKLRKNREDLMAKTGCTVVRFTVYIKDGKAALKATPVKDYVMFWPVACGAFIAHDESVRINDALELAVVREGTRTTLTVQNRYRGPLDDFALLVPVPVVLHAEDVHTLDPSVFARLDQITSPQVYEMFERDPCGGPIDGGFDEGARPTGAQQAPGGVAVVASFAIGEYQVQVLSADDAVGLDAWLHAHDYAVPANLAPRLRPYIESGSKFFVAKVDPSKVKLVDGVATLSPLRFSYDSDDVSIPLRLSATNSPGVQDVLVYTIAATRMQAANRPEVAMPSGLDLTEDAAKDLGGFYAALFARVLVKTPHAVVTEYAAPAWAIQDALPALGADGGASTYVLSRLHLQVERDGSLDDLVLTAAPPAPLRSGNPWSPDPTVPTEGDTDAFSTFFTVHHPWTGPARCAHPQWKSWRPDPGRLSTGVSRQTQPSGAIEDLVTHDIASLDVVAAHKPAPAPAPVAATGGSKHGGCCDSGGGDPDGAALLALLAIAGLHARRQ